MTNLLRLLFDESLCLFRIQVDIAVDDAKHNYVWPFCLEHFLDVCKESLMIEIVLNEDFVQDSADYKAININILNLGRGDGVIKRSNKGEELEG